MGIAQIALDFPLPLPYVKWANMEKSAPNHPGKPLHPPFPLQTMPIWKQHISKRGFPNANLFFDVLSVSSLGSQLA